MSSAIPLLPNPCLIALLLICQTRTGAGAQLVFHYPPNPLSEDQLQDGRSAGDRHVEDDTDSNADDWFSDGDDFPVVSRVNSTFGFRIGSGGLHEANDSIEALSGSKLNDSLDLKEQALLGLGEDGLVALLSPDRTWHKRKFELGFNELTFIGRPVFARLDGSWGKRKKNEKSHSEVETVADLTLSTDEDNDGTRRERADEDEEQRSRQKSAKSHLTMFHMVFVMKPPPLEHTQRVKDMYDNVVKKFSKALKWEQANNDFVYQQAEVITSHKSVMASTRRNSRSELTAELLQRSLLATAMSHVFNAISNSRIASINLSPGVSVSLQIPPVTSTSYLPSLTEPALQPGLWLTTATEPSSANADSDLSVQSSTLLLAKSYTLLLKSRPDRIARDAQAAGGSLASHLPDFVGALRPTKSFYKLSGTSQISIADIQLLARHLIYWRRAIAIPPLHQRDTYIVSPNADFSKIKEACQSYEAQFPPTMPSLPKLLSAMSGIPKPFLSWIHSPDHKEIYMLVLAWLMRSGWVTQLRTFAYVRISPEIKRAVKGRERDGRFRSITDQGQKRDTLDNRKMSTSYLSRPSFASHPSSDDKKSLEAGKQTNNIRTASLILDPLRVSPDESQWLDYVGESILHEDLSQVSLSAEDRNELYHQWPVLVKYFDGSTNLEFIGIRENLKRKLVAVLLSRLGLDPDRGVEDAEGRNRSVLLTIRHW